jgi:uncharacterized protein (TIGR02246 family)
MVPKTSFDRAGSRQAGTSPVYRAQAGSLNYPEMRCSGPAVCNESIQTFSGENVRKKKVKENQTMTTRRLLLPLISWLALVTAACRTAGPASPSLTEDDLAALRRATAEYRDAEAVNDWPAVTMLYTRDAIRLLPNGPTVQGRDGILAEFEARPARITAYDQQITAVDGCGDMAMVRGVFSYTAETDGRVASGTGKYIAIYRRQNDGRWLIQQDIFNFDKAPD